jgi:hypothetical protein
MLSSAPSTSSFGHNSLLRDVKLEPSEIGAIAAMVADQVLVEFALTPRSDESRDNS